MCSQFGLKFSPVAFGAFSFIHGSDKTSLADNLFSGSIKSFLIKLIASLDTLLNSG